MTRPESNEAAPYYFRYIDLVPDHDIVNLFTSQLTKMNAFLADISQERSLHSYAPEKWTIRQVLNHINDTERVFLNRAFWFARGFQDPLPSFDQNTSAVAAAANEVPWTAHTEEFSNIRLATISFFQNLPQDAWFRTGIASDNPVTVRALAYIIAGHVLHHQNVLKERYLQRSL
jgi:uncharacterized damage-inducible protein DinB